MSEGIIVQLFGFSSSSSSMEMRFFVLGPLQKCEAIARLRCVMGRGSQLPKPAAQDRHGVWVYLQERYVVVRRSAS